MKEKYNKTVLIFPVSVDWNDSNGYDNNTLKELACKNGGVYTHFNSKLVVVCSCMYVFG